MKLKKSYLIGIGAILFISILIMLIGPKILIEYTLSNLGYESSRSPEDVREIALKKSVVSLAQIDTVDMVFILPTEDLNFVLKETIKIAVDRSQFPILLDSIFVEPSEQLIRIGADFEIPIEGDKFIITGKAVGIVGASIVQDELQLMPAFEKIEITKLIAREKWWWPDQIIKLINPLLLEYRDRINAAINPINYDINFETNADQKIEIGGKKVELPQVGIKSASILVEKRGLFVIADCIGRPAHREPAPSYTAFQKEFHQLTSSVLDKSAYNKLGLKLSNSFIKHIYGDLAQMLVGTDRRFIALKAAEEMLKTINGPDLALHIDSNALTSILENEINNKLAEANKGQAKVDNPEVSLLDGGIRFSAQVSAPFIFDTNNGERKVDSKWKISLCFFPSIEADKVRIGSTIQEFALIDLKINDQPISRIKLLQPLQRFILFTKETLDQMLPAVLVDLPILKMEAISLAEELKKNTGVSVIKAETINPPPLHIKKSAVLIDRQGVILLADIGVEIVNDVQKQETNLLVDPGTINAMEIRKSFQAKIAEQFGETPEALAFVGFKWSRLSSITNAIIGNAKANFKYAFDTGNKQIPRTPVDLIDKPTYRCKRDECKRRSCSKCPVYEGNLCPPFKCPFKYSNPDCLAREGACNTAAGAEFEACKAAAELKYQTCQAGWLVQDGLTRIDHVGAIGGEVRAHGTINVDLHSLKLDTNVPALSTDIGLKADLEVWTGIDWTPHEILGHIICPGRGRVVAKTRAVVSPQTNTLRASFVQANGGEYSEKLIISAAMDKFKLNGRVSPPLAEAILRENPHIVATCPVPSALMLAGILGPPTLKAVGINDLDKAFRESELGALFGGNFEFEPKDALLFEFEWKISPLFISQREFKLKGQLRQNDLLFIATD